MKPILVISTPSLYYTSNLHFFTNVSLVNLVLDILFFFAFHLFIFFWFTFPFNCLEMNLSKRSELIFDLLVFGCTWKSSFASLGGLRRLDDDLVVVVGEIGARLGTICHHRTKLTLLSPTAFVMTSQGSPRRLLRLSHLLNNIVQEVLMHPDVLCSLADFDEGSNVDGRAR